MADIGHQMTDDVIEEIEKKLAREYSKAEKEMEQKLNEYLRKFEIKDSIKRAEVAAGTLSEAEYKKWRYGQICVGERWKEMKDTLAQDCANVDSIARSIIADYMPEVYALNHNYATYQVEKDALVDTSYTLYNRRTIEHLIKDDPYLLPFANTNSPRAQMLRERMDLIWNRQHLDSVITQAVLQGESIPQISKRLRKVTDMDRKAATRNARTMMTSAENKGRQDAYDSLREKGIELQEIWVATLDQRTRHSHRQLHGEAKDQKTGEFSNGLRFPADPMGDPEEVYNCRCCMIAEVENTHVKIAKKSPKMGDMSFKEWQRRRR